MALAGRSAPLASQRSSKKHRMHPQAAVCPSLSTIGLGWGGRGALVHGLLAGQAGWLVADRAAVAARQG